MSQSGGQDAHFFPKSLCLTATGTYVWIVEQSPEVAFDEESPDREDVASNSQQEGRH